MSAVRIAAATAEDTDAIGTIHHLSHTVSYAMFFDVSPFNWPPLADYRMRWHDTLANLTPGDALYVARHDGGVVGFIYIESLSDRYVYYDQALNTGLAPATTGVVRQFHIHPDHLGQGIGQALMVVGKAFMRDQGWTHAVLDTQALNARARRFYDADGWTVFDRTEHARVPLEMILYRCNL